MVVVPTSAVRGPVTAGLVAVAGVPSTVAWTVVPGAAAASPKASVVVAGDTPGASMPETVNRLVSTVLTPGPPMFGPSMRTKFCGTASGLPMTGCGVAASPVKPAGAAGAAAGSQRR